MPCTTHCNSQVVAERIAQASSAALATAKVSEERKEAALEKAKEQATLLRSQRDALQAEFAKAGQQLTAARKSEAELKAQLAQSAATTQEITALRQALSLAEEVSLCAIMVSLYCKF